MARQMSQKCNALTKNLKMWKGPLNNSLVNKSSASSPGSAYIFKSHYPDIQEPNMPLNHFLWQDINKWPNHIAVECAVSGKKYSYNELYVKSRRFGASLKKLGFNQGDSIGIFLPNIPDYPIAYFGSLEIGLVPNTINPIFTSVELSNQIKDTDSKGIICHPMNLHVVQAAKKILKKDMITICTNNIDGTRPGNDGGIALFEEMLDDSVSTSDLTELDVNLTDSALINFSSGTTGLPKGVCLTHRSLTTNLTQMLQPPLKQHIPTHGDHQDVIPAFLPFYHAYGGIGILFTCMLNGSKVVSMPKFDMTTLLQVIDTSRSVLLMVVPPVIMMLSSSPHVTANHVRNIREVLTAGAPISRHDLDNFSSLCKAPIAQAYGMTEASPMFTKNATTDYIQNPSSVGKLLANTWCKILDIDTGKILPPNTAGHLCFKGPQLMKGYLNNPVATSETIDSEGWLSSGDIGYCDDNGFFYIIDRLKEMIKVSGHQVAPAEVEEVLRKHPGVVEAGVVGIPNDRTGETPVAFVQVKPGTKPTVEDIMSFVASQLSKHKRISAVKFVQCVPTTASGKILRRELKKLI